MTYIYAVMLLHAYVKKPKKHSNRKWCNFMDAMWQDVEKMKAYLLLLFIP